VRSRLRTLRRLVSGDRSYWWWRAEEDEGAYAIRAVRKDDVALATHGAQNRGAAFGTECDECIELPKPSRLAEAGEMGPESATRFDGLWSIRRLRAEDRLSPEHATPSGYSLFASPRLFAQYSVLDLGAPLRVREVFEAVGTFEANRDLIGHLTVGPEEAARTLHGLRASGKMEAERACARPIRDALREMLSERTGRQVDELGESVGGLDEVDGVRSSEATWRTTAQRPPGIVFSTTPASFGGTLRFVEAQRSKRGSSTPEGHGGQGILNVALVLRERPFWMRHSLNLRIEHRCASGRLGARGRPPGVG